MRAATLTAMALLASGLQDASPRQVPEAERWSNVFVVPPDEWSDRGRNPFFVLEPRYRLVLESGATRLIVTVLDETRVVDGVTTRVVEERETVGGKLSEVSRNYFAISRRTSSLYYFGEDVEIPGSGGNVKRTGSWLAGDGGARFGLMLPGEPLLGARFYQEFAPKVAMDRAEIVSLRGQVSTPAGTFTDCLVIEETTPLEPGVKERKYFARGIGLVQDGDLRLVRWTR